MFNRGVKTLDFKKAQEIEEVLEARKTLHKVYKRINFMMNTLEPEAITIKWATKSDELKYGAVFDLKSLSADLQSVIHGFDLAVQYVRKQEPKIFQKVQR